MRSLFLWLWLFANVVGTEAWASANNADFCRILNLKNELIGVVTTTSGKVARHRKTTDTYTVEGIAADTGLTYLVWQRDGLVVSEMARVTADGRIFDVEDWVSRPGIAPWLIGRLDDDGNILDRHKQIVGHFAGCEHLDAELRTYLVGAGAARFLLFKFDFDKWLKAYRSCPAGLCTW